MHLPLMVMVLRFVATPILGIAMFSGLLLTLVGNNIVDKLLEADFYTDTIAEHLQPCLRRCSTGLEGQGYGPGASWGRQSCGS